MKNFRILLVVLLAISITSCQFTEEITIHKNGSGSYKLNVDMSGMMSSMSGLSKNDSIQKDPEKIDSIIYLKDILEAKKDSISKLSDSDKAMLDAVKDMKIRIQVDEEKSALFMDFMTDFKDIADINDIKKRVEKAQQLQDNKGKAEQPIENHDIQYSYSKKKFSRHVIMKELTDEEQKKFEENQNQNNMFLSGSKYKLIYNFPKKIKKVSYSDAKISDNHKSLVIEIEMDSLIKNPQLLDFEVNF